MLNLLRKALFLSVVFLISGCALLIEQQILSTKSIEMHGTPVHKMKKMIEAQTRHFCVQENQCFPYLYVPVNRNFKTIESNTTGESNGIVSRVSRLIKRDELPDIEGNVLIIHGFMMSKEWMMESASYFRSLGLNVYLIDLLGHGDNTFEKGFGVNDIPFIQQFIQTEIESDVPLYIVGNSMGSLPAMALAKANNVKGVILQAPMIRFDQAATAFVREQNAWYTPLLPKQTIHQGVLGALDAQQIAVKETDITLTLPDVKKPVLIFASDIDSISPYNVWKNYENEFLQVIKIAKRPHALMTLVGQKEHDEIIRWFSLLNSSKTSISRQSFDQIEDMHLSTQIPPDNTAVFDREESLPD